jgi:hypothetical protein
LLLGGLEGQCALLLLLQQEAGGAGQQHVQRVLAVGGGANRDVPHVQRAGGAGGLGEHGLHQLHQGIGAIVKHNFDTKHKL